MSAPTSASVRRAFDKLGHRIFDGKGPSGEFRDLDLNLFGWRTANGQVNAFDDWVGVFWAKSGGGWEYCVWPATTDPGRHHLNHPSNVAGTAVMAEGQYLGAYGIGLHRSSYVALVQEGAVKVFRDRNGDDVIDMLPDQTQIGHFGINIHRANRHFRSVQVDKWSAGCQVLADPGQFEELMDICRAARDLWGGRFTYTLISEAQLENLPVGAANSNVNTAADSGDTEAAESSTADWLKYVVAKRPKNHKTYESLQAMTSLVITEAVIGRIKTDRLDKKVPGLVTDKRDSELTADRLNRDFGPLAAKRSRYLRWNPVAVVSLRQCKSVMDFLTVCHDHLARREPG